MTLDELDASSLLRFANQAGVSATVDCQCPGLFINGRPMDELRELEGVHPICLLP